MRQRREDLARSAPEAEEEKPVAPPATLAAGNAAVARVLDEQGHGGAHLPVPVREEMEQRLDADLSEVRVHTGARANSLNRSIQAEAFTAGSDIFFSQGSYDPASANGRELLTHELVHVVQQQTAGPLTGDAAVSQPHDPAEVRAREIARDIGQAHGVGNRAAAVLARQPAPAPAPAPARVDEREGLMRNTAFDAINSYEAATGRGISRAVTTLGSVTDWGPFASALVGNLIWASACFATGGTAFVISLAGIGVGAVGSLPKDKEDIATWAMDHFITKIGEQLRHQVAAVASQTYAAVRDQPWDDDRIRREILGKLFKPEFIGLYGGIPETNQPAIEHRVHADALIQANRQVRDPHPLQNPGYVHYFYTVKGHVGSGYAYGDALQPIDRWTFELSAAELTMELGGAQAVAELKKDPLLKPAEMPLVKVIHIESGGDDRGSITLVLDGQNKFFRSNRNVVFRGIDERVILEHLWRGSGGKPADVESAKLK